MKKLTCFKAYDIRGKLGEELNEDIAWRIGRAYGEFLKPKTIVLGGDVRLTSETLKLALAKGLQDAGVDVLDIGMSGTEEIYFATFHLGVDGGIEVTPFFCSLIEQPSTRHLARTSGLIPDPLSRIMILSISSISFFPIRLIFFVK